MRAEAADDLIWMIDQQHVARVETDDELRLRPLEGSVGRIVDAELATWSGIALLLEKDPKARELASGYNNLSMILGRKGRLDDAEVLCRRSIRLHAEGGEENTLPWAIARCNLAVTLADQFKAGPHRPEAKKKLREAERILIDLRDRWDKIRGTPIQRAQALCSVLDSLANVLAALGELSDAEAAHRGHLQFAEATFGEHAPEVARAKVSLAGCLADQGRMIAARDLYSDALEASRPYLGEHHPDVVRMHAQLGMVMFHLDDPGAEGCLLRAARGVDVNQALISYAGPERARLRTEIAANHALAVYYASEGRPADAWRAIEAGLSPGFGDDLGAYREAWTDVERRELRALRGSQIMADRLALFGATSGASPTTVASLRSAADAATARWLRAMHDLAKRYPAIAPPRYDLRDVQKCVPPDTALVGWIDMESSSRKRSIREQHWAYVIRAKGDPTWIRLPGSDGRRGWSDEDKLLAADVYWIMAADRARYPQADDEGVGRLGDWRTPAKALYELRMRPLEAHFQETNGLPPVKTLIVLPSPGIDPLPIEILTAAAPDRPDLTISYCPSASFYAWLQGRKPSSRQPKLLVIGDPEPRPASGSEADNVRNAGLGSAVESSDARGKRNDVASPRELSAEARRGQAAAAYTQLPGFAKSIDSVARLAPGTTSVVGGAATVEALDNLAMQDGLLSYTHIYVAAHGQQNEMDPYGSSIILSDDEAYEAGRVRTRWRLDADVVTLGTCDSGLGRFDPSEGHTGMTQAFLLAGARGVVVTRWKVSAESTGLLSIRFHQNILGARPGLEEPMSKTDALREAKEWIQALPDKERREYFPDDPNPSPAGPAFLSSPAAVGDGAFRHPRFWAGMVHVGDPS